MENINNKIQTKENTTTMIIPNKLNKEKNTMEQINQNNNMQEQIIINYLSKLSNPFVTLTVEQVSKDLHIGINQAYYLFKQKDFPTTTIGKRKTVTLASYLLWKMDKKENEVK